MNWSEFDDYDYEREAAARELRKGDVRHIYVREGGEVSVSRNSYGPRTDKRTGATITQLEDEVRQASRCKPGRKAGAPVYIKMG
jgi:hypothetical protein